MSNNATTAYEMRFKNTLKKEIKDRWLNSFFNDFTQQLVQDRETWNYLRFQYLINSLLNMNKYHNQFDYRIFMFNEDRAKLNRQKQVTFADIMSAWQKYIYAHFEKDEDLIPDYFDEWRIYILKTPNLDIIADKIFQQYKPLLESKQNPDFYHFIDDDSIYTDLLIKQLPQYLVSGLHLSKSLDQVVGLELRWYHRAKDGHLRRTETQRHDLPSGKHDIKVNQPNSNDNFTPITKIK